MVRTICNLNKDRPYNRQCYKTICCIECDEVDTCEAKCDWDADECGYLELIDNS